MSETLDSTALRQTIADVRARLDQQAATVAEAFQSLRAELDVLESQVSELAEVQAANTSGEAPTVKVVSAAQPIPVGKPVDSIPIATPVAAPEDQPSPSDFNFDRASATTEDAKPSDFDFAAREESTQPLEPKSTAVTPAAATIGPPAEEEIDMEQVMFGPDLAANQSLHLQRESLLQGLYTADPAALTLLGHLLIFRGAPPDRLPGLLKDIGEAYYRWRPDTSGTADDFRDELTGWLLRRCDEAGVPNSIELVLPGDRYDSKRHYSKERGVEVAHVRGWVVLRDNGKVYTKASVTLK